MPTFFNATNGEIIDLDTAEVVGYKNDWFIELPPLSDRAKNLLRHWDGMSMEPLGTILQ